MQTDALQVHIPQLELGRAAVVIAVLHGFFSVLNEYGNLPIAKWPLKSQHRVNQHRPQ